MVTKYRDNPTKHLTFLEASKTLSGSVDQLAAIWGFLDTWGIINAAASETAEIETIPQTDAGELHVLCPCALF